MQEAFRSQVEEQAKLWQEALHGSETMKAQIRQMILYHSLCEEKKHPECKPCPDGTGNMNRQAGCRQKTNGKERGFLKNLEHVCYNTRFSHIYVERRIRNHPRTEQILLRFPQAQIVEIEHYKDVFNRHGQDGVRQHQAQALILAEKPIIFFMKEHRSVRILAIPIFITVPQ